MKNLILSTSSGYNWEQIKKWNLSAAATGNEVCNILVNPSEEMCRDIDQNVPEHGCRVLRFDPRSLNKPPHNLRFLFQYKYLMEIKDKHPYVVVTDSRDVYFHSDPFPRIKEILNTTGKDILCGSECIAYKDEHWGNGNLMEGFGYVYDEFCGNEICNVGVLCGKTEAVAELCLMIFTMCYHNPASVSDQSSFNILMGTDFGRKRIAVTRPSDGVMVHLGTVGVEKFRDKLTEKPSWIDWEIPTLWFGKVIPIIHQYDRVDTSKWWI